MKKLFTRVSIAAGTLLTIGVASAQEVDVSAVVASFQSDASTAIGLIGLALVTLAGIAVTYKWIKGTFFS